MSLTTWQILLVGKDKQQTLLHLAVGQYPVELLLGLVDAFPVLAVDDEDEPLGAGVVMPPEGADLVLATDVPYIELDILVCDRLNVEAD